MHYFWKSTSSKKTTVAIRNPCIIWSLCCVSEPAQTQCAWTRPLHIGVTVWLTFSISLASHWWIVWSASVLQSFLLRSVPEHCNVCECPMSCGVLCTLSMEQILFFYLKMEPISWWGVNDMKVLRWVDSLCATPAPNQRPLVGRTLLTHLLTAVCNQCF